MDRRTFLTGIGALGAGTTAGLAATDASLGNARADGLARAAGATKAAIPGGRVGAGRAGALQQGLTVGYLQDSWMLLDFAAQGRSWNPNGRALRWAAWQPEMSRPVRGARADVSIGMLRPASGTGEGAMLRSLQVVAHFAIDSSPHFAPFDAWQYAAPAPGKRGTKTSPLTFEAPVPDRVGLQVNYALEPERLLPGIAASGMVYLPIGAVNGPGAGIYVVAGPSRTSGAMPDLTRYTYTGDLIAPLRSDSGAPPDFDYVPLTIASVAA